MENIVLTVHLILALLLVGVVLLQRSEGGGLGMGGGGGGAGGGVMTGRQAANALSRATWILATAFLITSLTLTIIAARNASSGSIVDQLDLGGSRSAPATTLPGVGSYVPPPGAGQPVTPGAGQPITPPAPNTAPASDAAANSDPVTPPAAAPAAPAAETDAAPATTAPAQPAN